jgi:WXG100 family type VII secretion target
MAIMNFNYNQAISQANQLDAIANEMQDAANKQLQTAVDSIEACWRGEASQQFIGRCVVTQTDICTQAKKLRDLAKRIRTVAKIIEEAEQRAKEQQRRENAASASGGGLSGGGKRF